MVFTGQRKTLRSNRPFILSDFERRRRGDEAEISRAEEGELPENSGIGFHAAAEEGRPQQRRQQTSPRANGQVQSQETPRQGRNADAKDRRKGGNED